MSPHINVRTFGSGPRPVLALHCTLAHSGAWRGLAGALGDTVTLHAPDLPNHGKSGDWDGQGDLHDTATAMALEVLDDVGAPPIDVIGHSFGGTVALRLAIEHPDRVRSVAMFEPVFFAAALADSADFAAEYARDTAAFDAALQAGDTTQATRVFNATWGNGTDWDSIAQSTRDYMVARIGFVRDSTPFVIHDCAGLLAPGKFDLAQMPALLLQGETSPWSGVVNAAIAWRLPNAHIVTLKGAGHMAPITDPAAVAAEIASFWRRA